MRRPSKFVVYIVGVVLLGLAYEPLKEWLGNPISFAIFIAYLLVLRLAAERFGK